MTPLEVIAHPAVIPLLTAFLVIITGIYAYLTFRIASANSMMIKQLELQHESQTRPVIAVNIAIEQGTVMVLVLKNKGASPAQDLRLSLDRDFYTFSEKRDTSNVRLFEAFQSSIPSLSPGDELRFYLSQGFNLNKEVDGVVVTPLTFEVRATYGSSTKKYDEAFIVDLKPYMNSQAPRRIVDVLTKIESHLKKLAHA